MTKLGAPGGSPKRQGRATEPRRATPGSAAAEWDSSSLARPLPHLAASPPPAPRCTHRSPPQVLGDAGPSAGASPPTSCSPHLGRSSRTQALLPASHRTFSTRSSAARLLFQPQAPRRPRVTRRGLRARAAGGTAPAAPWHPTRLGLTGSFPPVPNHGLPERQARPEGS